MKPFRCYQAELVAEDNQGETATASLTFANWKDTLSEYNVMIATIARSGGENGDYTPGTAGVDPTQNLNQTDLLGLPGGYGFYSVVEAESIYIGCKYYETRYADTVLGQSNASDAVGNTDGVAWSYENEVTYPFGYGLSYATFTQALDSLRIDLEAQTVTVTNTGDVAGKDTVQLYVSLTYTDYDREHLVEKSAIQMLNYGKTDELQPGESQTIPLTTDAEYLSSWDSTADNAADTQGCYILDQGDYYFAVGNGAREALNNALAVQGKTGADGMTAEGDAANVQI